MWGMIRMVLGGKCAIPGLGWSLVICGHKMKDDPGMHPIGIAGNGVGGAIHN